MHYQWDFGFLQRYMPLLWKGTLVTLAYTAGTILLGLLIGLLLGLARLSRSRLVNTPLVALIEAFRCTPLLVQIVWVYYALPVLLHIQIPAVAAATRHALALHRRRSTPRSSAAASSRSSADSGTRRGRWACGAGR